MATKKAFQFEKSLTDLETIVQRMEAGDLTLEDALKQFEQGIKLTRECQQALTQAEQKVAMLMENGDLATQNETNDDEQ